MAVKVGQVYADKDIRMGGRHVLVKEIAGLYAYVVMCNSTGGVLDGGRRTRVSLKGVGTRFRLVKDAGPDPNLVFQETVYRAMRAYQQGTLSGNGTAVGQLDQPLTALYDRIVEASKVFIR